MRCAQSSASVTHSSNPSSSSRSQSRSFVPTTFAEINNEMNDGLSDKTCDWSSEASRSLRLGTAPSQRTSRSLVRRRGLGNSSSSDDSDDDLGMSGTEFSVRVLMSSPSLVMYSRGPSSRAKSSSLSRVVSTNSQPPITINRINITTQ